MNGRTLLLEFTDDHCMYWRHCQIQFLVPDFDFKLDAADERSPEQSSVSFVRFVWLRVSVEYFLQIFRQLDRVVLKGRPELWREYQRGQWEHFTWNKYDTIRRLANCRRQQFIPSSVVSSVVWMCEFILFESVISFSMTWQVCSIVSSKRNLSNSKLRISRSGLKSSWDRSRSASKLRYSFTNTSLLP